MKQFEKWKQKFAEAENGWELSLAISNMFSEHEDTVCLYTRNCKNSCRNCRAEWLDSEVKEDDDA